MHCPPSTVAASQRPKGGRTGPSTSGSRTRPGGLPIGLADAQDEVARRSRSGTRCSPRWWYFRRAARADPAFLSQTPDDYAHSIAQCGLLDRAMRRTCRAARRRRSSHGLTGEHQAGAPPGEDVVGTLFAKPVPPSNWTPVLTGCGDCLLAPQGPRARHDRPAETRRLLAARGARHFAHGGRDVIRRARNAIVAPIHPKAMRVVLTTPPDPDVWHEAETLAALALRCPCGRRTPHRRKRREGRRRVRLIVLPFAGLLALTKRPRAGEKELDCDYADGTQSARSERDRQRANSSVEVRRTMPVRQWPSVRSMLPRDRRSRLQVAGWATSSGVANRFLPCTLLHGLDAQLRQTNIW